MLSRAALENLSLYYYIKEVPLARHFSEEAVNVPLVPNTRQDKNGNVSSYYTLDPNNGFGVLVGQLGRGFLSFDIEDYRSCEVYSETIGDFVNIQETPFKNGSYSIPTIRESNYIAVRDQFNNVLDRADYDIDYLNARIRWRGAIGTIPSYIDCRFHLVSCIDGWPSETNSPDVPFVALYPTTQDNEGLQIGPGIMYKRRYELDVYSTSNLQMMEILDTIKSHMYLKRVPVIDFNRNGYPLKPWGIINSNFITTISHNGVDYNTYLTLNPGNGNVIYIRDIEVIYNSTPRKTAGQAARHTGKIIIHTETQSDRDPVNVGRFNQLTPPPGGFDSLLNL